MGGRTFECLDAVINRYTFDLAQNDTDLVTANYDYSI